FPYAILIPAALFLAQMPRWLAAGLLAGNLAFTIEMNIARGADARVGTRALFLLVLSAATVAAVRIRRTRRDGDRSPATGRTDSFHRIESAFAVAGVCALLVLLIPLVSHAVGSPPETIGIDLARASGVRPVDDGTGAPGVAVSSDGRRVVFVGAAASGTRRLFVYDVASS